MACQLQCRSSTRLDYEKSRKNAGQLFQRLLSARKSEETAVLLDTKTTVAEPSIKIEEGEGFSPQVNVGITKHPKKKFGFSAF